MEVTDIGLRAALAVNRIQAIKAVSRANRLVWVYPDDPSVFDLRERYLSGNLEGNLLVYNQQLRAYQDLLKGLSRGTR